MRIAVVGAGVVGLSSALRFIERGDDVSCYEAGPAPMAARSAGSSRIFRLAHADPHLVELAARARVGFEAWSARAGTPMVGPETLVVTGTEVPEWTAALAAAEARHQVRDELPASLPAHGVAPGAVLVDPAGGVVAVDAVRSYLTAAVGARLVPEEVTAVEAGSDGVTVWSTGGRRRYDRVVLAAGAGTAPLAAPLGLAVPAALAHHVRFSFPLAPEYRAAAAGPPPAWIDRPPPDRDGGHDPDTYQHRSPDGSWAVGAELDPALVAWEVGREEAEERSRAAVTGYARRRLRVVPEIVSSLYCTTNPGLHDGIHVVGAGPVTALYGENLMKFAPLLGELVEQARVG